VSERYLARAHVVLVCGERDDDIARAEEWIARHAPAPRIRVRTKCDLSPEEQSGRRGGDVLAVSAERGFGLTALLDAIDAALESSSGMPEPDMPVLTHTRHVTALRAAREEVRQFAEAREARTLPAPVAAVHLRAAVGMLEELIGSVDIEQVLERVFRTFCVGK
jgi:tRNA modification GTPase